MKRLLRTCGLGLIATAVHATALAGAQPDPAQPRIEERARLLRRGEAALALRQVDVAQQNLERAALIAHSADTEMVMVRSHMQRGDYRRALAFCAHTAGAHLDEIEGAALYAWLLFVGGQSAVAQRVLDDALKRAPGQALLEKVAVQLRSRVPVANGLLLDAPARMAPYGLSAGLPSHARTAGTAVLIDRGRRALLPLATVSRPGGLWLRNGLGQLSRARVERRLIGIGVAVLRLDTPLPAASGLSPPPRDAFPGSVGLAVEYIASADATPRWPVLTSGFLGNSVTAPDVRRLGVDLPTGPRGGPVFDNAGRFVGMALAGAHADGDKLVLASTLQRALGAGMGAALGAAAMSGPATAMPLDVVYEAALRSALQVIVER